MVSTPMGGLPNLTMLPIPVWIALGFAALIVTIGLYIELFEIGSRVYEFGDRAWVLGLLLISIFFSVVYYGIGARYFYHFAFQRSGFSRDTMEQAMIAGAIFFLCGVPYAAMLYYKLGSRILSDAEKAHDLTGVRAWLRPRNVVGALIIAITAFIGSYEYLSYWLVFIGLMIVLLAYPVGKILNELAQEVPAQAAPARAAQAPNLTDERERVLKLLEEGKISTEESVELLNALTESARAEAASARRGMSPAQRVKMLGVGVLVVAFFLPWLKVDLTREMERLTRTLNESISQMTGVPNLPMGNSNAKITISPKGVGQLSGGNTITLRGGDMGYGLGWMILVLGVAAAGLPWIAPGMNELTMRRAMVIAAAAGAILLAYVLFSNLRWATFGIAVAIAGYGLIGIGLMKEGGARVAGRAAVTEG